MDKKTEFAGNSGLILNEPLLWEKGSSGRRAYSLPNQDIPQAEIDSNLISADKPNFPDLSELEVVRHYTRLSTWNFGVDTGMYPLGSCTMKYNPKINEKIASLAKFSAAHPLLPAQACQGTLRVLYETEQMLCQITGLKAACLQPSAGAHGELLGLMLIKAWHKANGKNPKKMLVPDTAHGTNPATCGLCGFEAVKVPSDAKGILSVEAVTELMDENCAGIMVTNPNTLGLFEANLKEIAKIVHARGGLIYGDGANLNAVMGYADMDKIGIDVMHVNVHKTFSTPHGAGGPGAGPICVSETLIPFLPDPRLQEKNGVLEWAEPSELSIGRVHPFWGQFAVLLRCWAYILTMGPELKTASELAVLNANYIKVKLKDTFNLPYNTDSLHECVFTDKNQEAYKISTLDIAKRLIDYGFHPPTVYFPLVVQGAIMIEPTETESPEELDAFIAVMKKIAEEAKLEPELLHNAPTRTKVQRIDEVGAARKPVLTGDMVYNLF